MATAGPTATRIGTTIRSPRTSELVADHLRRRIARGEVRPGDILPSEQQLLEQYGVSRPTLREAFRVLEAEGLITVRRGTRGGPLVLDPDVSIASRYVAVLLQMHGTTITDVYEARMISEPPCAALLALRRTDADVENLTRVVDELKGELAARQPFVPDPYTWSALTCRFHELILEGSGNKTMALQGAVLQDIVTIHLRTKIAQRDGSGTAARFRRVIASYARLVELVAAGDVPEAERHWRSHMEGAARYLLEDDLRVKPVVDLFG